MIIATADMQCYNLYSLFSIIIWSVNFGSSLDDFVSYYETLNYPPLKAKRHRRHAHSFYADEYRPNENMDFYFRSHNRTFDVRLLPLDVSDNAFANDLVIDVNGEDRTKWIRRSNILFSGYLLGDLQSNVYGSVIDGIFDGRIITGGGESFSVEKAMKYFDSTRNFHSVIYADRNVRRISNHVSRRVKRSFIFSDSPDGCGLTKTVADKMFEVQKSFLSDSVDRFGSKKGEIKATKKGNLYDVRTCAMYIIADHLLYEQVFNREGMKDVSKTYEELAALIHAHLRTANSIYLRTDFNGVRGINFVVQRITIFDDKSCVNGESSSFVNRTNPFCDEHVDVSNFLNIHSQQDHSSFCLAYAMTFRDFVGGTLGLAWVSNPDNLIAGGVCFASTMIRGGMTRSLNTGIFTLLNYGRRVPERNSHLTMAHEIGHNFGSPHDEDTGCAPGSPEGNYIMFASATPGDLPNNDKFSACSVGNISAVLHKLLALPPVDIQKSANQWSGEKRNCFRASQDSFCGNRKREKGEECDCGFTRDECNMANDKCCQPPMEFKKYGCKRVKRAACSPSEGPCCNPKTCQFYTEADNQFCSPETECLMKQKCNGSSVACPAPKNKPDGTECEDNTLVCQSGACNVSVCTKFGYESCFVESHEVSLQCQLGCSKPENKKCQSTFDLDEFGEGKFNQIKREGERGLLLPPGAPCNNYKGFCDIFRKCRSVDANGALAKLRNFLTNKENLETASKWIKENWWACVLIAIDVILFMCCFVRCCTVYTPSHNPKQPKALKFKDTIKNPRLLITPTCQQQMIKEYYCSANDDEAVLPQQTKRVYDTSRNRHRRKSIQQKLHDDYYDIHAAKRRYRKKLRRYREEMDIYRSKYGDPSQSQRAPSTVATARPRSSIH